MDYQRIENSLREIFNSRIRDNEAILKEWKSVTYPTKKNGEPFAVMSKNIAGANYRKEKYNSPEGVNIIEVRIPINDIHDACDFIRVYEYSQYMEDESKKAKKQNILPNLVYSYDLDDIKEAIKNRIICIEEKIEKDKRKLENIRETEDFKKCVEFSKNPW